MVAHDTFVRTIDHPITEGVSNILHEKENFDFFKYITLN